MHETRGIGTDTKGDNCFLRPRSLDQKTADNDQKYLKLVDAHEKHVTIDLSKVVTIIDIKPYEKLIKDIVTNSLSLKLIDPQKIYSGVTLSSKIPKRCRYQHSRSCDKSKENHNKNMHDQKQAIM